MSEKSKKNIPENTGVSSKNLEILKKNTREQFSWLREWVNSERYFTLLTKEYDGDAEQARTEWERRKNELQRFDIKKDIKYVPWMDERQLGRYLPINNSLGIEKEVINNTTFLYAGKIAIAESATREKYSSTPVHEMTHKLNNSGEFLLQKTAENILERTQRTPEYPDDGPVKIDPKTRLPFYSVNNPTEWVARLEQLRFLLQKEGIFDAKKGEFTHEHIQKLKKNKTIQQFLIEDSGILDNLEGKNKTEKYENLKWFLNNIADNHIQSLDTSPLKIEQNLDTLQNRVDIA